MPETSEKASRILKTASKTLNYPKRNKRMLEKKKANVQEGIECNELLSKARKLLSKVRSKYSIQ